MQGNLENLFFWSSDIHRYVRAAQPCTSPPHQGPTYNTQKWGGQTQNNNMMTRCNTTGKETHKACVNHLPGPSKLTKLQYQHNGPARRPQAVESAKQTQPTTTPRNNARGVPAHTGWPNPPSQILAHKDTRAQPVTPPRQVCRSIRLSLPSPTPVSGPWHQSHLDGLRPRCTCGAGAGPRFQI